MRNALMAALLLASTSLSAQTADGIWYGALSLGAKQLRLAFTFSGSTATLSSLDQGASNIPATTVES